MASERHHALSPLGSALSSAHPSSKSIAEPESAVPPSSSPTPSHLAASDPPLPVSGSSRPSHLRPSFTLDDPADESADDLATHDGSAAPPAAAAAHGSRRDILASEQQQQKSRPSSTRSIGAQPSTRSADAAGPRLRPRSYFSDRRPVNYESRPGHGSTPGGEGPTESRSKADDKKPDLAQSSFGRALHQILHNPVFPLDWVGPALSKRSNLKVLFRCTLSVRPQINAHCAPCASAYDWPPPCFGRHGSVCCSSSSRKPRRCSARPPSLFSSSVRLDNVISGHMAR